MLVVILVLIVLLVLEVIIEIKYFKNVILEAVEFERCPNVIESSTLSDYVINYLDVFKNTKLNESQFKLLVASLERKGLIKLDRTAPDYKYWRIGLTQDGQNVLNSIRK